MALGPGALSLLLQPTHVNNPASGQGIHQAARIQEEKRQNQWYRGQREQETAEQRRQFDVSHDFEVGKFAHGMQEKRRLEKAAAWDELLDADASQDPQKMLAAWQKARAKGINVPGYEERLNTLFSGSKPPTTETAPPADTKPAVKGKGASIRGPLVGESIGDGWEVVETPPEAREDAPAPAKWLTNEMESRGEIPVQPLSSGWEPSPETPAQGLGPPQGLAGGLPQTPKAPQPPGALVAYDEDTGQAIGTVSPETAIARSRARLREALSPLVENARTPEEQRAAAIAMDTGQRGVGTMPVDKLIASAQERYDAELGRDTAKTVARGGKAAGTGEVAAGAPPDKTMYERAGRTPEEIRAIKAISDYVHTKIIQKAQQVHNTKELQRVAGTARAVAAKVNKEGGFAQRQSIRDILRMTEGARQTDADLNYALRGDGALGQLHLKLNEYIASGTLPHNFKQQISDYATLLDAHNRDRQKKAAAYAREFAMQDTGLRDMVGEEDLAHWAEQAARGAMGEAIGPTPKKATGNREVDSLVEELEGAD